MTIKRLRADRDEFVWGRSEIGGDLQAYLCDSASEADCVERRMRKQKMLAIRRGTIGRILGE